MRTKNSGLCIIMLFITLIVYTSCRDDIHGNSTFLGKVSIYPSSVKNGEEVIIKTGGYGNSSIYITMEINGKNVIKSISYYIDGEKVAESFDKDSGYSAKYVVNNLSEGPHVVTAHCESNFKHYKIEENITAATLQVQD